MTQTADNVANFQAAREQALKGGEEARDVSIAERITRRKALLKRWLKDGISEEEHEIFKRLPRSLTQMREWEEPAIGIYRIGSPNAFLKSNNDVSDIAKLLTRLHKKYEVPPPKARRLAASTQSVSDLGEWRLAVSQAVSRWHEERACRLAADEARKRADDREKLSRREAEQGRKDLREAEQRIADLERTIRMLTSPLKVVE